MHLFDDFAKLAGRDREIEKQVVVQSGIAERTQLLLQLCVSRVLGQIADAIKNIFCKLRPDFFIHRFRAGKLVERRAQFLPP